ncbi:MAG: hypothetical protein JXP36_03285 [Bacteroidales bacterium]|nr:hypothetical protein [Bacteroidales bacterium]
MKRFIFIVLLAMLVIRVSAQSNTVTGKITKQGTSNHSGILVHFEMIAPGNSIFEVYTDITGEYLAEIDPGVYNIIFSESGYKNNWFMNQILLTDKTLPDIELQDKGRKILIPSEFTTIQDALDYCNSEDSIIISEGTYYENLILPVDKELFISSNYCSKKDTSIISNTIINGSNSAHVIEISNYAGNSLSILGLTITNGYDNFHGGGLYITTSNNINIRKCKITNNTVGTTSIWGNTYGAGIYIGNSVDCILDSCMILSNICLNKSGMLENGYGSAGGGLCVENSNILIYNAIISKNEAHGGYYYADYTGAGGVYI